MTTYEIVYDQPEGAEKRAKAVADIQSYLGQERYEEISGLLIQAQEAGELRQGFKAMIMPLIMVGVQGYPVRAWYETLFGPPEVEAARIIQSGG
jgi:hypothetical protein